MREILKKFDRYLLIAGGFFTALSCFFGNAVIAGSQILLILGLVICYTKVLKNRTSVEHGLHTSRALPASAIALAAFVGFSAVSVLANLDTIESPLRYLKKLRHFVIPILFLGSALAVSLFQENRKLRSFVIGAWLFSIFLATTAGLIAHFFGYNPILLKPPSIPTQASGFFGQSMTYSYSLQFAVLILGVGLVMRSGITKITSIPTWCWGLVSMVSFLGMYFSYSRGAMLGILVGAIVFIFLYSKKLLIPLVILGILVGGIAYKSETRYFHSISGDHRSSQWMTAALTFLENPFFGVGYQRFEEVCVEQKVKFSMEKDSHDGEKHMSGHAHNVYLEIFASSGVGAGLSFLIFCFLWAREANQGAMSRLFFLPVLSALAVSAMFESFFSDSEVAVHLMFLYVASQIGLSFESSSRASKSVEDPNTAFAESE